MKTVRRTVTGIAGRRIEFELLGLVALAAVLGACGGSSADGAGTKGGDLNWAEWPMPNGATDVAAGAPNPEHYTVNGDGTVTDDVTGLMWQQTVPNTLTAWAGAMAYCPALTLGGYTNWRLPTEIELISLVDFSDGVGGEANAAIDGTAFPSAPSTGFWSSTPLPVSSAAWLVDFDFNGGNGAVSATVSSFNAVRCVR